MKRLVIISIFTIFVACTQASNGSDVAPDVSRGTDGRSNVGIRFGDMPVGLRAVYSNSRGLTWVNEYLGKAGSYYVWEYRDAADGELLETEYYNENGILHHRVYPDGNGRTFMPHRCIRVLGRCEFEYTNTQGTNGESSHTLTRKGDKFVSAYPDGDVDQYWFGKYNLVTKVDEGNYSHRLIEIIEPS